MMNNKNLTGENSALQIEAQVVRCLLNVNVVKLFLKRKRKLRNLRLPFNEANSPRDYFKII